MEDDNVLDIRVAHWRNDPVTRELLEIIERMNEDQRLILLEYYAKRLLLISDKDPALMQRLLTIVRRGIA